MPDPRILALNLEILHRRDPQTAARVQAAAFPSSLDAVVSRAGLLVPRLRVGERMVALHSTVDPVREAERTTREIRAEYVLCLGLGGGYHLPPLLRLPATQRVLVIETQADLLRGFLSIVDLRDVLADPRVELRLAQPAEARRIVLGDYLPAAYRSFCTFPLRARVDADIERWSELARAVEEALSSVSRDYAVQSRFGLRWLRNTLGNLRALAQRPTAGEGGRLQRIDARRTLVTGAGPSLEAQIPRIRELRPDSFLIAADASLIPLCAAGITPDLVLSVDCQQVVYHHFLAGLPASSMLALDIASPPLIARLTRDPIFVSTLHPLARYLSRRGLDLPYVDVTGGNVCHAAVALADSMGAREIRLFGVDLSYPSATPYARGCFLYPALAARSSRLAPLEGSVTGFVLASPGVRRVAAPKGAAYITETMAAYRESLRELVSRLAARVVQEPGMGPPLDLALPRPPLTPREEPTGTGGGGAPGGRIADLLLGYAREVEDLPHPDRSFPSYVASLDAGQREVLATLLPVVAARQAALGYPGLAEIFNDTKELVLRSLRGAQGAAASPTG